MKKLIIITGAFLIICVIISGVLDLSASSYDNLKSNSESPIQQSEYVVKSANGKIVVYQGNTMIYRTNTAVNTLPKKDQKELLYGIQADTKEEVKLIIEQYCS